MAQATLIMRVRPGPAVQGVFELLKLASDAMEVVPDWCPEKAELAEKIEELAEMLPHQIEIEADNRDLFPPSG
jgi:hypothetical protein